MSEFGKVVVTSTPAEINFFKALALLKFRENILEKKTVLWKKGVEIWAFGGIFYLSVIRRQVQNYSVASFTWVWFKKINSELSCCILYLSVVRRPVQGNYFVFSTWVCWTKNQCFLSGIPSARVEGAGPCILKVWRKISLSLSAWMFGPAPTAWWIFNSVCCILYLSVVRRETRSLTFCCILCLNTSQPLSPLSKSSSYLLHYAIFYERSKTIFASESKMF